MPCHIFSCYVLSYLVVSKVKFLTSNKLTSTGRIFTEEFVFGSNFSILFSQKARAFLDFRRIQVKGGNGGNGAMSFLSVFGKEYAGPDGGDGGNGGHVIIQGNNH